METSDRTTNDLGVVREAIDELDERLVRLFAERLGLADRAHLLKQRDGLPPTDPEREAVIVRRAGELARSLHLDPEIVRTIFWRVLGLSHAARESRQTGPTS